MACEVRPVSTTRCIKKNIEKSTCKSRLTGKQYLHGCLVNFKCSEVARSIWRKANKKICKWRVTFCNWLAQTCNSPLTGKRTLNSHVGFLSSADAGGFLDKLSMTVGAGLIIGGISPIRKNIEKTTCNSRVTGKRGLRSFKDPFWCFFTVKNCIKKWWKFAYRFLRKVETARGKSLASYVLYLATIKILFCVCLAHARQQGLGTPVATGVAFQSTYPLTGKVLSAVDNIPLEGATVGIQNKQTKVFTNADGAFRILASDTSGVLIVSYIGYESTKINFNRREVGPFTILLESNGTQLEEVEVSTGYQTLPKERATGSFSFVDSALINRVVSTNIIDRLADVTPGLIFNKGQGAAAGLLIRGQSSINSNARPLVVVDNFPYEEDIVNINPNDVETMTVLKDAAAASIWGARAGNGVIVITTKKGKHNQKKRLSFNSNLTIGEEPNWFYQPIMSTQEFIEEEKHLFETGFHDAAENSVNKYPVTPVVELLFAERAGHLSSEQLNRSIEELTQNDVRQDYKRFLGRNKLNQQYAISMSGGNALQHYYLSAGVDRNLDNMVGDAYDRMSLKFSNNYSLIENKLEIVTDFFLTKSKNTNNSIGIPSMFSSTGVQGYPLYPYAQLMDASGSPLEVVKQYRLGFLRASESAGLLDWSYRPLQELAAADNTQRIADYRINGTLRYKLNANISADLLYQYAQSANKGRNLQTLESFYTRDQINRLSQIDPATGTVVRPIPMGDILDISNSDMNSHNVRAQINYRKDWEQKHSINAIAGAEVRAQRIIGNTYRFYGYNDRYATSQSVDYTGTYTSFVNSASRNNRIINRDGVSEMNDRYISYYGNAAYSYAGLYTLSGSIRFDQSNLFGVKTNQKGIPLYSIGLGWNLSEENFFSSTLFPYLKLRATYGYSGNVNKNLSAYTTAYFSNRDQNTSLPYATIQNPPNPNLRWERVATTNVGVDFATKERRIDGSIEYYFKKGTDIIGTMPYPSSTGVFSFTGNYAQTRGEGLDLIINTLNVNRGLKWSSSFQWSYVSDKVTAYALEPTTTSLLDGGDGTSIVPIEGKPLFSVYSLKWAGLDPQTGDPLGYLNGEISNNYQAILSSLKPADLTYHGRATPAIYGAFRNTFTYKNLSISANVSYRFSYYFRRQSVNYGSVLLGMGGHADYARRWQKPGDELHTQVPSRPSVNNSSRNGLYQRSEYLVEKGDHIRLQDINLSYTLSNGIRRLPFRQIHFYVYANNLGVLWKATNQPLDPDYSTAQFPPVRSVAFGIKAEL